MKKIKYSTRRLSRECIPPPSEVI